MNYDIIPNSFVPSFVAIIIIVVGVIGVIFALMASNIMDSRSPARKRLISVIVLLAFVAGIVMSSTLLLQEEARINAEARPILMGNIETKYDLDTSTLETDNKADGDGTYHFVSKTEAGIRQFSITFENNEPFLNITEELSEAEANSLLK
jgi:hypothetical protein